MRQGQPYEVPANKVAVCLRKATTERDQVLVDSADYLSVALTVSWLQSVIYVAL